MTEQAAITNSEWAAAPKQDQQGQQNQSDRPAPPEQKVTPSNLKANRTYGRRKGPKLRASQQALLDELLPKLRLVPPAEGRWRRDDLHALFPVAVKDIALEIGFGAAEHLLYQAERAPSTGFIGCEPYLNGVAKAVAGISRQGLANVRLYDGDARDLLTVLPDDSLTCIYLLFPDPWPKKRHHKRRFVSPPVVRELARVLASGGQFRFASDIADYVRWTLNHLIRTPEFEWCAETARDWRQRPEGWPPTRYEEKALAAGRKPAYLTFRRI